MAAPFYKVAYYLYILCFPTCLAAIDKIIHLKYNRLLFTDNVGRRCVCSWWKPGTDWRRRRTDRLLLRLLGAISFSVPPPRLYAVHILRWSLTYVMLPNHRHLYNNFTAMYRPQSVYNILVIAIGSTCCCSIETAYHVTFNGCSLRLASTEFISCMRLNLHNTSSFSLHTIRYKCIHIWNWRFWERGASGSHCGENGVGRRRL